LANDLKKLIHRPIFLFSRTKLETFTKRHWTHTTNSYMTTSRKRTNMDQRTLYGKLTGNWKKFRVG
jgi:hypothetical protein